MTEVKPQPSPGPAAQRAAQPDGRAVPGSPNSGVLRDPSRSMVSPREVHPDKHPEEERGFYTRLFQDFQAATD